MAQAIFNGGSNEARCGRSRLLRSATNAIARAERRTTGELLGIEGTGIETVAVFMPQKV